MAISLSELTNGTTVVKEVDGLNTHTWQGSAVFDVLVRMVNENLKIQYDEGRIKATDYAEAYIAGLQTCITEAMNYIMQKDNLMKDIEVKQANINLTNRQADNLLKDNALKEANLLLIAEQKANLLKDLEVKEAGILLTTQQIANLLKDADLKEANKELVTQQKTALIKDDAVKDANISLLNRQQAGFDDNKNQKLFEAQMNAWALMFSSGILEDKPTIIRNDAVSALYDTLKP